MRKLKIIAIFAAVVAGIALYSFLNYLSKPTEVPKTTVVVAVQDIAANTTITKEMLSYSDIPTEAVLSDAVTDEQQAVGKVMKSDVLAGEQITSRRLVQVGETNSSGTLSYLVEPGMRAITISVDATTGLSNMIKPGNMVDIVAQYVQNKTDATGAQTQEQAAKLLVQNVKVLAVDSVMDKAGVASDVSYSTITLSVTPAQAVNLSFVSQTGKLRAILRSPLDTDTANTGSVTGETIQGK